MSVIIRLQGLSWSASAMDIRNFFQGLSIPPGGVRIIGGENGDAFIAFSTDEDARQAMMLTTKSLNDCPVQLFLSSKTEMQNTISQAKDKTPSVPAPVAPAVSVNLGAALLSQQIPSVEQISQVFPAVGQIMGSLGLQQPQPMQTNQLPSGFQRTLPQGNVAPSSGFMDNSLLNNPLLKGKSLNRFEQELPGEYSVGGIQGLSTQLDVKYNSQRPVSYGDAVGGSFRNQPDAMKQGLSGAQQHFGNAGPKDSFRGEVFVPQKTLPQLGSQNQPWESGNQQHNLNQNNPNMAFENKQPFNNQQTNYPGHGKPFHGEQGNLNSHQYGHGKPFHSENSGVNSFQSFPGIRPNFPPNSRPGDTNFPQSGRFNDVPNSRQADMNIQQRNDIMSQLNIPPASIQQSQNFPGRNNQGNDRFNESGRPFDQSLTQTSIADKPSIQPRARKSTSRFSPATAQNDSNFPQMNRQNDLGSQTKDPNSINSPTKSTTGRAIDTRGKAELEKPSVQTDKKTGVVLSNKRDEFGRNLPFLGREGNDSSRTPTQDEKYDESRSRDSSDARLRENDKRISRDRDRSRDLSSRRDSPRDRDRRERDRDRGRRDRDDDKRSRRDRDRDRKPRERDNDRYERNRDSKDRDRKNSPTSESNRKARKRSLSPSSKNKNDNEKKMQTEKPRQESKLNDSKIDNSQKTSLSDSRSNNRSINNTAGLLDEDMGKKSRPGSQPLFPVVPLPKSGKGLLGEAPATLPENFNIAFGNFNPPHPLSQIGNIDGPNNAGVGGEGPRGGPQGGPLRPPMNNVLPPGIHSRPPDRHIRHGMDDQTETLEYEHSGGRGRPREDYRGPDREFPPFNQKGFPNQHTGRSDHPMDNQERPGFNRGRGGRDGPFQGPPGHERPFEHRGGPPFEEHRGGPPFEEHRGGPSFEEHRGCPPFEEQRGRPPFDEHRGGPPFDEHGKREFRGPLQGPGPRGPDGALPFGDRNTDFKGREGRRSLLGDGGAQHALRGHPTEMQGERFPPDSQGPPPGPYGAHDRRFDNRLANERQPMPNIMDEVPFRNRRDFQGRPGRDFIPGRDGPPPEFLNEPYEHRPEFHGNDDRNMFGPPGRNDQSFERRDGPPRNMQDSDDFRGQDGFRGEDRYFNREQIDSRENRGPPGRSFDRMPDNIRGPNIGPPNNRDMYGDRNRMQSDRDRDRRPFDRDGQTHDNERGPERRDRFDNRPPGRHQDRIDPGRDRSNERERDDRYRGQYGSERDKDSYGDDKNRDIDDRRNRNEAGRNLSKENNDKQNENRKDVKFNEKTKDSKEDTTLTDTTKSGALCSVVLENIPVETTYRDIRRLFAGLDLPKDGIKIINNNEGKRIGKAYVRFGSQDSFKKGLQKDRSALGIKFIVIKPVARREFDNAIDSYLPPEDDDEAAPDLDMCNSLSATLRALKGEPELKVQKKSATPNTKDFIVKITLLPEYVKLQKIKSYFHGLNIAKNGEAIVIESNRFKTCTGLCYVEFGDEDSFKKALEMTKMLDRKTIKITDGSKKEMNDLSNKMKAETNSKIAGRKEDENTNIKNEDKEDSNTIVKDNKQSEIDKTNNSSNESNATSAELSKSPLLKISPSCICIRVRNIPKSMKVFELRNVFVSPDVIVRNAQICHDAVGKAIGEGYVEFSSNVDVQKSIAKNETYVGKNKITVEPVTKAEMIENMRLLRQSLQPETPTTQAVFYFVKAAKLPKNVSTGEIMNFFSGYNPAPESIRLNIGDGSEPADSSTALVGFRTREHAETAISATNGNLLRNKNVSLSKVDSRK